VVLAQKLVPRTIIPGCTHVMLAKSCRYRSTTRITARRVSSDTSRPLRRFTPPQCRIQYRQYSLFVPFPGVQVSKAALNLDSELPQVHDCIDTNDYLVVVFGWLRAEQRPLHKYVQLHNSRGIVLKINPIFLPLSLTV